MSDFKAEKSMFTAFYKNVLIIVQTDQEVCSGKFRYFGVLLSAN